MWVKYFRILKSNKNELLIQNKEIKKFFVYVTDDEMKKYLNGKNTKNNTYRNELSKFYKAGINELKVINFFANDTDVPKTFRKSANDSFSENYEDNISLNIIKAFETDFTTRLNGLKLFVKIYEVL